MLLTITQNLIENPDKDIQVKVNAISLLGKHKRNEAVPTLISIIRDGTGLNIFKSTRTDVIAEKHLSITRCTIL